MLHRNGCERNGSFVIFFFLSFFFFFFGSAWYCVRVHMRTRIIDGSFQEILVSARNTSEVKNCYFHQQVQSFAGFLPSREKTSVQTFQG